MNTHKQTVPEFLDRTFARFRDLPHSHVEAACDRVLQRLQGEIPRRPIVDPVPHRVRQGQNWRRFAAIAAVVVVVFAVLFVQTRELTLAEGEILRTSGDGVVLTLSDGSRVEMRPQSEMFVEPADDGLRLRLNHGAVIINLAVQRTGKFHVRTDDLTATVAAGVFLVSAEPAGSRVAVIQGEVRVQQGTSETNLGQGEQFATSPQMESRTVPEVLPWSRSAETHLAQLLEPRLTLEERCGPPDLRSIVRENGWNLRLLRVLWWQYNCQRDSDRE